MLREYARRLAINPQGTNDTAATRGTLSDVQLHLNTPLYGEVDGTPVTIIGQGNMTGFSPVSKCIDGDGETAWIPDSAVLITDQRFRPVGQTRQTTTERNRLT